MGHRKVVAKRDKVTKAELDRRVASELGVGFHRVAQVTRELIHQINRAVLYEDVSIYGFGHFSVTRYSVRSGSMRVKRWRYALRFRPSRVLREAVRRANHNNPMVRNEDEND